MGAGAAAVAGTGVDAGTVAAGGGGGGGGGGGASLAAGPQAIINVDASEKVAMKPSLDVRIMA